RAGKHDAVVPQGCVVSQPLDSCDPVAFHAGDLVEEDVPGAFLRGGERVDGSYQRVEVSVPPAVAGRVEDAARVDSPGDQLFHRPFDLDALPHAPGPEEEIQPVRLDVGQDVGSIDERRRGDASEVAVAACPVRVAPPEVRCRELLFDLAGLHGPAPRKSIPFRRTIRKKVYFFAVSSSRKYTFLPLTPRWGAHGRAAGATSSPANERCATPQRHRGAFPDRNGRA